MRFGQLPIARGNHIRYISVLYQIVRLAVRVAVRVKVRVKVMIRVRVRVKVRVSEAKRISGI